MCAREREREWGGGARATTGQTNERIMLEVRKGKKHMDTVEKQIIPPKK